MNRGQPIITDSRVVGVYWGRKPKSDDVHIVVMPDLYDEPRIMELVGRRFEIYRTNGGGS